jgi:hypothetical protein
MHGELVRKLASTGQFSQAVDFKPSDNSTDFMTLEVTITKFDKGDRFARWFFGFFGAGKAEMIATGTFSGRNSTEHSSTVAGHAIITGGFLGGGVNQKKMAATCASQIAKATKKFVFLPAGTRNLLPAGFAFAKVRIRVKEELTVDGFTYKGKHWIKGKPDIVASEVFVLKSEKSGTRYKILPEIITEFQLYNKIEKRWVDVQTPVSASTLRQAGIQ